MSGALAVQVARDDVFESNLGAGAPPSPASGAPSEGQQPAVVTMRASDADVREEIAVTCSEGVAELPAGVAGQDISGVSVAATEGNGGSPAITVARHSRLAPYKPGKMTVVLDMDECLLHSKFHGPGAATEAYRQLEERPEAVNEVNSFWVALDDGDTAQVSLNMAVFSLYEIHGSRKMSNSLFTLTSILSSPNSLQFSESRMLSCRRRSAIGAW